MVHPQALNIRSQIRMYALDISRAVHLYQAAGPLIMVQQRFGQLFVCRQSDTDLIFVIVSPLRQLCIRVQIANAFNRWRL